jgi:two-component system OmpR family response regulator
MNRVSKEKITTILYVDDEADIQAIAKLALETLGPFTVTLCSSGRDAIELLKSHQYDCIMLDVMMPTMTGPETLLAMRACCKELPPVIFITAKIQKDERKYYESLGCAGIIGKPFDPLLLHKSVERALLRPK